MIVRRIPTIRFFIQKTNDVESPIYEVTSSNFRKYSNNQSFSCENNIETLINIYSKFYNQIEKLNNNHSIFQLDLFKSKSNK